MKKLLGLAEVAELARVSRQAVVNWRVRHKDFPAPVVEVSSGPIWRREDIERWLHRKTDRRPIWALAGGLPPSHVVRAAVHVAGLIDRQGSSTSSTHHGYRHYPSGGIFPPEDLRLGERLLIDCGLVREEGGVLYPAADLSSFFGSPQREAIDLLLARALSAAPPAWIELGQSPPPDVIGVLNELITDPDRREALLLAIGSRFDLTFWAALGARGEEEVARAARQELEELGRDDLASRVQRVSLISDRLGYDVVAPRIDGVVRRMEVKTTSAYRNGTCIFYLSRNEIEAGRRDPSWALVVCKIEADESVGISGWCRAVALEPYVPVDSPGGRWQEAELVVAHSLLIPGLPRAV